MCFFGLIPAYSFILVRDMIDDIVLFEKEPMRKHTTLRIGGTVSTYITVTGIEALRKLIKRFQERGQRYIVIGGGSNIVWPDDDLDLVVINLSGLRHIKRIDERTVLAGAGLSLSALVRYTASSGLKGLEGLFGIPGTVGGAIKGNAGAFGYEIKDTLYYVKVIDACGEFREISSDDIIFGYRSSSIKDEEIIVEGAFRLKEGSRGILIDTMRQYLKKRRQTQPIGLPSAGCVFKNPPEDFAGRLIDEAGCKGMRSGGMEVSTVHANFIVNRGKGTQKDFLTLMEMVQDRVMKRFKIFLEPEVKIIRA